MRRDEQPATPVRFQSPANSRSIRQKSVAGRPAFDLAGISYPVGVPLLRVFCEGRESETPAPSGFDHVSTTKSNSARSIAAHPCKERKDGAPLNRNGVRKDRLKLGHPPYHGISGFTTSPRQGHGARLFVECFRPNESVMVTCNVASFSVASRIPRAMKHSQPSAAIPI